MSKTLQSWLLLIILSIIWGSSFILIKKGLEVYSPLQVACLRIGIAGLSLLPIALMNLKKVSAKQFKYILAFGLCNAGLPAFLFAMAQTKINSSTSGILNSLTPLFTFLVGILFFKVLFTYQKLLGVIIGFVGALMLILYRDSEITGGTEQTHIIYFLMIVFATLLYGFSANIIKHHLQDVPGKVISSFAYLSYGVPLIGVLFFTGFTETVQQPQALESLGYIALLAVAGSAVAIIFFSKLIQMSNALFASFVTYLIPVVAILWGWFIGESVSVITFFALIIILVGVTIASPPKKAKSPGV